MEIEINDSEVLDLISEFLYSRKLFRSADALEQEINKQPAYSMKQLSQNIYFLREFIKNGQWDGVLQFLLAFRDLDNFPMKDALCSLFCQIYCESSIGNNMNDSFEKFKNVMDEIKSICSLDQFMENNFLNYIKNQAAKHPSRNEFITATRFDFFYKLHSMLEPFLIKQPQDGSNARLVNLLAKGLLYDRCIMQCCQAATNNNIHSLNEIGNKLLLSKNNSDPMDDNVIGSLYNWIQNLNGLEIFSQSFEDKNVQIIENKIEPSSVNERTTNITDTFGCGDATVNDETIVNETKPSDQTQIIESEEKVQEENSARSEENSTRSERAKLLQKVSERLEDGKRIQQELSAYLPQNQKENSQDETSKTEPPQQPEIQKADEPHNEKSTSSKPTFSLSYFPVEATKDPSAIRAVAFNPKGAVYAVGSNSRTLKLCQVPNEAFNSNKSSEHRKKQRVVGQPHYRCRLNNIHSGSIYALAWNDEGNLLASCSNDKSIKLLQFDDHRSYIFGDTTEIMLNHRGIIRDIVFLPGNNSVLASGGSVDYYVYTSDCEMGTMLHKLKGHSDQILSLSAWNNGLIASASQDQSVRIWDIRTDRCVSVVGFGQQSVPTSININNTGEYLAVGRDDSIVSIYDLTAGKTILDYKVHDHEVRSVRFNPVQSNLLLSGSYDNSACVTDISALLAVPDSNVVNNSFKCDFHSDKVIQCRWHPHGFSFASTSADTTCVLWGSERVF